MLSKRGELLDYLDQLIPEYEMPNHRSGAVADKRLVYDWSEFLDFYGEDFIRNAYLCIFKREVDVSGLQSSTHALNVEACSRVKLLGRLRYSDEGRRHAVEIKGLWIRFQLARLQRIPLLGSLLGLVMNLDKLVRPENEVDALDAEIVSNRKKLAAVEEAISGHYNSVVEELDVSVEKATHYTPHGTVSQDSAETIPLDDKDQHAAGQRAQLKPISVLTFMMQLPKAIRFLSRIDTLLENQRREISECDREISRMEMRLMQHYNDTLKHLKREVAEALKSDLTR